MTVSKTVANRLRLKRLRFKNGDLIAIHFPPHAPPRALDGMAKAIAAAAEEQGVKICPAIIVLGAGAKLERLDDERLRQIGLMRIGSGPHVCDTTPKQRSHDAWGPL